MASRPDIEAEIRARLFPLSSSHLLGVGDLSAGEAVRLLDLADAFYTFNAQQRRSLDLLKGLTAANLFFESSTRTRTSFEIAAKRLGADVANLDVATSSTAKGETLVDTALTIDAMGADLMVVRHAGEGAVAEVAAAVGASVINAGDGRNEHPTQGLLDALTIRRAFGRIEGLTVAICGDLRHSRVARSNARLLPRLGAKVRMAGPHELMPERAEDGVELVGRLEDAIEGADVVMMLRIQRERMDAASAPSPGAFFSEWGLDRTRLARAAPGVRVMHPGPMNRGVEMDSDLADDPDLSLVRAQVTSGVAVRMAVMAALAARRG
jgi:aspartate carbamoyltransferase catalytic subunit